MALPAHRPTTRAALVLIEITATLPATLRVLHRELGARRTARVVGRAIRASRADPLASVARGGWPADREAMCRQQVCGAIALDDALAGVVADDRRLAVLRAVIAEAGAQFIARALHLPAAGAWRRAGHHARQTFVRQVTARFFNIRVDRMEHGDDALGFDVGACRLAELAHAVGRPYLAPMFCAADSVYFSRPDVPITLGRTQTIAAGDDRCDFRFTYRRRSR